VRISRLFLTLLLVSSSHSSALLQMITEPEARAVAEGWASLVVQMEGAWGGSAEVQVDQVETLERDGRMLGYFYSVEPRGFIVVSLRKELAPVKAWSPTADPDPFSEEGMVGFIKTGMARVLNAVEERLGPIATLAPEEIAPLLSIDYRNTWRDVEFGHLRSGYQEGEILLSSGWRQSDPYNRACPAPPEGSPCDWAHCAVGCIATAGAQVMRYWCWPPHGDSSPCDDPFDWPNMPDILSAQSPQVEIDAVTELCYELGLQIDMQYCYDTCASGAYFAGYPGPDLLDAFEDHFFYGDAEDLNHEYWDPIAWFDRMKVELNQNRPVPYSIPGHAVVADGWREAGDDPVLRQYHINYGHGPTAWCDGSPCTYWYTLDAIYGSDPDEEAMLVGIVPETAFGSTVPPGIYAPEVPIPYRYFDQDAVVSPPGTALFEPGQHLQFLPDVVLATSPGDSIQVGGSSEAETVIFAGADTTRGIRLREGSLLLANGGALRVR